MPGILELKWGYTEFEIPGLPFTTRARLGAQPWGSVATYKPGIHATGDFAGANLTMTFTVANLFDKKPPITGQDVGSSSFNSGNTYPSTYDALGRTYRVGARLRF